MLTELLADYGLFLAKTLTLLLALVVIMVLAGSFGGRRRGDTGHLEIRKLNERYLGFRDDLYAAMLDAAGRKARKRQLKKDSKREARARKTASDTPRGRLFVIDFHGDIRASGVNALREEISATLAVATATDEVVLRLESAGGLVNAYGLAASQLRRIRDAGVPLTVCVDKVAASGGYMMASVATRILAAPFAVLGSIGVIAQLPNFNRLLKKHDIDFELLTAGEYKRTLTLFGENTPEGRQKFTEELDDTHALFKEFVVANRPAVDIEAVATGEIWFGERAVSRQLVDELATSDSYLQRRMQDIDAYEVRYIEKKKLGERLAQQIRRTLALVTS